MTSGTRRPSACASCSRSWAGPRNCAGWSTKEMRTRCGTSPRSCAARAVPTRPTPC
ncbi:hypothetical protein ACFQ3Z_32435 [Streptomyces nogalater]